MKPETTNPETGMTADEERVVSALVVAWNEYMKLPRTISNDYMDFMRSVHECQRIIAQRVVARQFPGYWRQP